MERSVDAIRSYAVRQYIAVARRKGEKRVRIVAGDVHRALKLKNRVPNVCNALTSRIFLEQNHLAIEDVSGPPSGMGTRVIYTYRLLEEEESQAEATENPSFDKLRGLLKKSFQSLGGGEAFLREERARFHGHGAAEEKVSLVYWDTMLFIYWLEAHPRHGPQVQRVHRQMEQRGDELCTSVFTMGEILAGAYKTGHTSEAQQIRKFFESGSVRILPFNLEAADRYAMIRAQYRVSPADAIHLAAASLAQVDVYLTNDERLKKLLVDGIQFIVGLDGSIF